jgi:hypothetical protein
MPKELCLEPAPENWGAVVLVLLNPGPEIFL